MAGWIAWCIGKLPRRVAKRGFGRFAGRHHPARHELSQALGQRPEVAPEIRQLALQPGDWLILACDGLQNHLSHDDLRREIELALPAASFLAQRLIEVANERGGTDNCTVIVVHGA